MKQSELEKENAALRQQLEEQRKEMALLRQRIDLLVRRLFGPASEKLDPLQDELFRLDPPEPLPPGKSDASWAEPVQEASSAARGTKARPARQWPENLPVTEVVIDPPEVIAAPQDWRCIGSEINEQLDYEPGRFFRRRLIRRKYVSKVDDDQPPCLATLPAMLVERGALAPGLLAHIIVSKYCDHLPLYRQEQIFRQRYGVALGRQTMARWMETAADWLQLIYRDIRQGVLAGGYVQIDETSIHYLAPGHGKTRLGYFWTAARPGGDVFYHWKTSRAAQCLHDIVPEGWQGTIQCDGFAAYQSFARGQPGITLCFCWAHCRRKWYEAREQAPTRAGWVLRQIGYLYLIEKKLRQQRAGPRLRAAVRAHQSRPIVARLHRLFIKWKKDQTFLPKSGLGMALEYILHLWSQLLVYIDNGLLEIDQNLCENAIRPTAVGKRNWLFIGHAESGQRSAILFTIVECCRRRGLDPYAYLRDILTRLPSSTNQDIASLTPHAWSQPIRQAA